MGVTESSLTTLAKGTGDLPDFVVIVAIRLRETEIAPKFVLDITYWPDYRGNHPEDLLQRH